MSAVWASPMMGPWGGSIVISALCWRFSTARITLVSNRSPRILRILSRPVSTSLRMLGVILYFRAVYSTFIKHPPESLSLNKVRGERSDCRGEPTEGEPNRCDLEAFHLCNLISHLCNRFAIGFTSAI